MWCVLENHSKYFQWILIVGLCCDPCRVFFRRHTIRLKRKGPKPCPGKDGNCPESGKWACAECRYKRCLAIGMSPDQVSFSLQPRQAKDQSMSVYQHSSIILWEPDLSFSMEEEYWIQGISRQHEEIFLNAMPRELNEVKLYSTKARRNHFFPDPSEETHRTHVDIFTIRLAFQNLQQGKLVSVKLLIIWD